MKVSAIIPAFNAEPWIAEAINSIKSQSRPVHELIVVDDGSTDRTAEIARDLGAIVVRISVNSGEGVARNAGLEHATGDLIGWLDADDYWGDNHVEVLTGLLEKFPQAAVACAPVQRFGLRNELCEGAAPAGEPGNIFWNAVHTWVHPIIGAMMRRNALLSIGGFSTKKGPSVDYDMWLRLTREHLFVSTPVVTSYWRWHPAQQSRDYGSQLQAVYFFRRQYWENELKGKASEDTAKFAEIMRNMWYHDFLWGLEQNDLGVCQAVIQARGLIPDLDPEWVRSCCAALPSSMKIGSGGLFRNRMHLMAKRLYKLHWMF